MTGTLAPPRSRVPGDVGQVLVGRRALLGEAHRIGDLLLHVVVERAQLLLARAALLGQAAAGDAERVAPLPFVHLLARAVQARVGHRMAAEAVGADLDQTRLSG